MRKHLNLMLCLSKECKTDINKLKSIHTRLQGPLTMVLNLFTTVTHFETFLKLAAHLNQSADLELSVLAVWSNV